MHIGVKRLFATKVNRFHPILNLSMSCVFLSWFFNAELRNYQCVTDPTSGDYIHLIVTDAKTYHKIKSTLLEEGVDKAVVFDYFNLNKIEE